MVCCYLQLRLFFLSLCRYCPPNFSVRSLVSWMVAADRTDFAAVIIGSIYSMVAGTIRWVLCELWDVFIVSLKLMEVYVSIERLAF